MCYLIEISIPAVDRGDAARIARATLGKPDQLTLRAQRHVDAEVGSRFLLCEDGHGCACSLIADSADAQLDHLDLDPAKADRLATTLSRVAELAGPEGFEVRSDWVSASRYPPPRPPSRVTLEHLLAFVRARRWPSQLDVQVTPADEPR